ncbi:hypothetical protein [Tissierella sp.]|uniref:hypothetical protein n=1 Tax=Tissierella sp. TaxID=41274 RepID=UPI00285E9345|nr:hypothetical protein [Tissierella sp.]MDR7856059.1 hypothetical protein [Tissierella sp.]
MHLLYIGETEHKKTIPIKDIHFYAIKGDLKQEMEDRNKPKSNIDTMMAENLLGTAAAMKQNQVLQNIKTIDERKVIIKAMIGNKNTYIFFEGAGLYNYLLENLPEKEQSFVAMNR